MQKETLIKIDRNTDKKLEKLAEFEQRTKVGELRYLIKSRSEVLGISKK